MLRRGRSRGVGWATFGPVNEATPPTPRPPLLRFGEFELDAESLELRKAGALRSLPPQPARVLRLLAENAGRPVSREEIRQEVWGTDVVVDFEHGMNAAIRQVRAVLGDRAESPRFVQTLPKRGYRFLGPVSVVPREPVEAAAEPEVRDRSVSSRRPLSIGAVVLGIGVALASAALWPRPAPVASPPGGRILVAVLPLAEEDPVDGEPWLGQGLTEELIFRLSELAPERLAAVARGSALEVGAESAADAGEALGADYVLAGRVERGPSRLTVQAALTQVADEAELWSATFERGLGDWPALRDEIAASLAESLAVELLPTANARDASVDAAAWDAYLRGRFEWNRFDSEGLRRAIGHYENALELAPDLARAWAATAEAYDLLPFQGVLTPDEAYPKAKDAARRALELDDRLAGAHNALGFAHLYFDWDRGAADASFARAVELEPGYAMAWHWYAGLLSSAERHDEAVAAVEKALRLDPLSLSLSSDLVWYLAYADRYDEAAREGRRTLERAPDHGWTRYGTTLALELSGRPTEALAILREAAAADDRPLPASDGDDPAQVLRAAWRAFYRLDPERDEREASTVSRAAAYAHVCEPDGGEAEVALAVLARAVERRDGWCVFLRVDPRFDSLHGDERFETLVGRVGLD